MKLGDFAKIITALAAASPIEKYEVKVEDCYENYNLNGILVNVTTGEVIITKTRG